MDRKDNRVKKMKKRIILPAAAIIAVGAGSLGVAQYALADDQTPNPTASASASPDNPKTGTSTSGKGGKREGRAGKRGMDTSALASKLGIDETKLKAAVQKAREAVRPSSAPDKGTEADRATQQEKFATALASELGIDKEKVSAALKEIHAARQAEQKAALKARLDQAVSSGTLTQAEADAVMKAAEAGIVPMGGGPRR